MSPSLQTGRSKNQGCIYLHRYSWIHIYYLCTYVLPAQKNNLSFMVQKGLKSCWCHHKCFCTQYPPVWGLVWPHCDWAPGTLRLGASGVILVLMTTRRLGVTSQVLNSSPGSSGARALQRTCCRYLDDNPPIINIGPNCQLRKAWDILLGFIKTLYCSAPE